MKKIILTKSSVEVIHCDDVSNDSVIGFRTKGQKGLLALTQAGNSICSVTVVDADGDSEADTSAPVLTSIDSLKGGDEALGSLIRRTAPDVQYFKFKNIYELLNWLVD